MTIEISIALVRRLVATQFPQWANLPVTPVVLSGWDNRTFRLGETMAVRLPSAAGYVAQVDKEQRWLPRLAPQLPLPIPVPLALGSPSADYPWPWSVYRWLPGTPAAIASPIDLPQVAVSLAQFLGALQQIDPADGPPPGEHNFYRGGSLMIYDAETRAAIKALADQVDLQAATALWDAALTTAWNTPPVWLKANPCAGTWLPILSKFGMTISVRCSKSSSVVGLSATWCAASGHNAIILAGPSARICACYGMSLKPARPALPPSSTSSVLPSVSF